MSGGGARSGHGAAGRRRHRILVVEDDGPIREVLQTFLSDSGYEVRTAPNGLVGLEELREWRPDLIVLDMIMPVLDGRGFREAQTANEEWRHIPVLIMSAISGYLAPEATLGAKAVLAKPFDFEALAELVEEWVGREV